MNEARQDAFRARDRPDVPARFALPWRGLRPPRRMTGRERRWLDPEHGLFKRMERVLDGFTARYALPHLLGVWHPYCWLLPRRFALAVATVTPPLWPYDLNDLRVLLLSDIHTGAFLHPEVLGPILDELMGLEPDLVAVTGDIVEGGTPGRPGEASHVRLAGRQTWARRREARQRALNGATSGTYTSFTVGDLVPSLSSLGAPSRCAAGAT